MKVTIHTKECRSTVYLPTTIVASRGVMRLVFYFSRRYIVFNKEQQQVLRKQIRASRKQLKGMPLIEIYTQEGEEIRITL